MPSVIWNGRIPKYAMINICCPRVENPKEKIPPWSSPIIRMTRKDSTMLASA